MRFVKLIDLRVSLQAPVSKEAPTVRTKETPTIVEVEGSKDESESEAGEIIDVVQTIKPKRPEVSLPIIKDKVETAKKEVEPEEAMVKV
jgi:hypothetical protein